MLITAEQTNSRQTPTRLRLVAKAVKKLSPSVAMDQLKFMDLKAAKVMLQVFKQAVANAVNNLGLSAASLTIKEIIVNEGPHLKRYQPVSRGRAHAILKRSSHIRVVLESTETAVAKPKQVVKAEHKNEGGNKEEVKPMTSKISLAVPKKSIVRSQTTVKTVTTRKTGER